MKNTIITSATKYADKKIEEAKAVRNTLEKEAAVLKKEVESQIVKKRPDVNTLAGKMVESFIKTGEFCPLPSNLYPRIEPIEIDDLIQTIFDKTVVQTKRSKYNVYLFHPGKLLLTKIDVETMTKQEYNFEKT